MNWVGCTSEMKALAEQYLKANYMADWGPDDTPTIPARPALAPKKREAPTSGFTAFMSLIECHMDVDDSDLEPEPEPSVLPTSEVEKYLALPQLPLQRNGKDTNPLEWWKMHVHELPHLAKMARQFLAMPASSAGPERLFSAAGKMHDDQKKNTKEDTLSMMLEVKMNT